MEVPNSTHPKWKNIVQGNASYNLQFLAAKILLGRLIRDLKKDASPLTLQKCSNELCNLYKKNAQLPSAQKDIALIFSN